jgi:hypothetical protein
MEPQCIYITIGNSDDKLTQRDWMLFIHKVRFAVIEHCAKLHGEWHSEPVVSWQNACWCFDIATQKVDPLKSILRELAQEYQQDAIVWAEAKVSMLLPKK